MFSHLEVNPHKAIYYRVPGEWSRADGILGGAIADNNTMDFSFPNEGLLMRMVVLLMRMKTKGCLKIQMIQLVTKLQMKLRMLKGKVRKLDGMMEQLLDHHAES